MTLHYACIQINSIDDLNHNIMQACELIARAAAEGADVAVLPENAAYMSRGPEDLYSNAYYQNEHPALSAFKNMAHKHGIWLIIGSVAVRVSEKDRLANRCFVISPEGEITAFYDKIHLYDVAIKQGESHRESDRFFPGEQLVTTSIASLKTGLSICYDVRFGYVYRSLAKQGAQIITVPSAFTHHTGKAHWEILLRARAIEAQCYIVAPAQCGYHPNNRRTYGHSMIIDPWGRILTEASEEKPAVIIAPISPALISEIRTELPSLLGDATT